MTLEQYLAQLIAEECTEVGQRAIKLSRFGAFEQRPGAELNNIDELGYERDDLLTVMELLYFHVGNRECPTPYSIDARLAKHKKLIKYTAYSVTCGTVSRDVYVQLVNLIKNCWPAGTELIDKEV